MDDAAFAQSKLMEAQRLPEDTPNRDDIIRQWETEIRMQHQHEAMDAAALRIAARRYG